MQKTNYSALTTLTLVFFFWGFIAAGNSVFIPFCKTYFDLDQFQSQLVDSAFYGAYFLGALALFVFGSSRGKDVVSSWGYKKSIIFGLLVSFFGAIVMILAVKASTFPLMLLGLFIVALGFALQQTATNPFMILLGDEKTGSNRINLGGAINSLGTTIGPVIVAFVFFGSANQSAKTALSLEKPMYLYAVVAFLFLALASLLAFSKGVPAGKVNDDSEKTNSKKATLSLAVIAALVIGCFVPVFSSYRSKEAKQLTQLEERIAPIEKMQADNYQMMLSDEQKESFKQRDSIKKELENQRMLWLSLGVLSVVGGILISNLRAKSSPEGWGALKYPQVSLGMLAIFVYVGVEVAVGSNLGALLELKDFGSLKDAEITPFVSMFWGSLMIGRWTGSINAFNLKKETKLILKFIVPFVALAIILGVSLLSGYNIDSLYWYFVCVIVQILAYVITKDKPAFTLGVFGALGTLALLIGVFSTGMISIYAFLSAGLFCSIMWPCIFSLSLAGTGKFQSQGAALLVMMILGGALIPPLQGKLSDIVGIQNSFLVGALCFIYILFFALYIRKVLTKQGIDIDNQSNSESVEDESVLEH